MSQKKGMLKVERHNPVQDLVEPKVYTAYVTKPGVAPRRIEVERKKRQYAAFDITSKLKENGTMEYLRKIEMNIRENSIDSFSLSLFDNTDYESQSMIFWATMINSSNNVGLPARAMWVKHVESSDEIVIEWKKCSVVRARASRNEFDVVYDVDSREVVKSTTLERVFICFNAEDPKVYCDRLADAVSRKQKSNALIALNLYVDCMPVDSLRPLDAEQVNRVIKSSSSFPATRNMAENIALNLSSIIQDYNLNHMRTQNQLSFVDILKKQVKIISGMQIASMDYNLFPTANDVFRPWKDVQTDCEVPFSENAREFKFKSLYTKPEAIRIVLQMQNEIVNVEKVRYSIKPEKTLRIEEFVSNHQLSLQVMGQTMKETWTNAITSSVRQNLRDVKKGWLNIEESNYEVYNFSRLKRFLTRINIMMEDTIRNVMYRCADTYVTNIESFCPKEVRIISNDKVEIFGCNSTFPLFIVDLKFINPTTQQPQASFVFSSSKRQLSDAIMAPFDQSFDLLKGIVQVERRIMKKLFWASEPVIRIPHIEENWAQELRSRLLTQVDAALEYLNQYLVTLDDFVELISLDIKSYANDAEARFCSNESLNLSELCDLALNHMNEAETVFHKLPSSINLGIVLVDCKIVKNLLSVKHKNIALQLFEILERKTRDYAENLSQEFRVMYDTLSVNPTTVEQLTDMKEYLNTLSAKIELQSDKIKNCMSFFSILEDAKYSVAMDVLDLRWEVYRWPLKMANEIARQEKNFRSLEHQFKRSQEEEQQEFNQELLNLQGNRKILITNHCLLLQDAILIRTLVKLRAMVLMGFTLRY